MHSDFCNFFFHLLIPSKKRKKIIQTRKLIHTLEEFIQSNLSEYCTNIFFQILMNVMVWISSKIQICYNKTSVITCFKFVFLLSKNLFNCMQIYLIINITYQIICWMCQWCSQDFVMWKGGGYRPRLFYASGLLMINRGRDGGGSRRFDHYRLLYILHHDH